MSHASRSRRTLATLLLTATAALPLAAQGPGGYQPYSVVLDDRSNAHIMLELQRRSRVQAGDRKRVTAERRKLEFALRVADFTEAWNSLIEKGQKGVWNPKEAKATREAFERLVKSDGWMEVAK